MNKRWSQPKGTPHTRKEKRKVFWSDGRLGDRLVTLDGNERGRVPVNRVGKVRHQSPNGKASPFFTDSDSPKRDAKLQSPTGEGARAG